MKIIDQILTSDYFKNAPPVLIDIGASIEINPKWKRIAPYSICLAFDADDRDFKVNVKSDAGYKKLYLFNRIVVADDRKEADFYLTASPYCSSLLEPDMDKLNEWYFSPFFVVQKTAKIQCITVTEALDQAGINYIDWFKTDSQGTDLRLFRSLPAGIENKILMAEFEPGIMDSYKGEDKLFDVLKDFSVNGYWLSTMIMMGTQRLNHKYRNDLHFSHNALIKESPCWAELTFLHEAENLNQRSFLLLIIFALLEKQYGFALEVASKASVHFSDEIFPTAHTFILDHLKTQKKKAFLIKAKKRIKSFLGI